MPLSTIDNTGLSQSQILSAVNMPTGSVIQVVTASYNSQTSTTSTSYSSTGFSASITPQFSTSKILILLNMKPGTVANGAAVLYQIWRGGSSIYQFGVNTAYLNVSGLAEFHSSTSGCYLDSPASTSSVTYTIYFASLNSGQTAINNVNADISTITLMEIR